MDPALPREPDLPRGGGRRPAPGSGRLRGAVFNAAWLGAAALLLAGGLLFRVPAAALLGLLTLTTAGLARAWAAVALRGVTVERLLSAGRALPDDRLTLTLRLTNRKPLPVPWLTVEETLGEGLRVLDRPAAPSGQPGRQVLRFSTALRPFERVAWRTELACPTRGLHPVGPAELRAGDPFAFFADRRLGTDATAVLVYPRVLPLPALGLPPRVPLGETRVARHLLADPARVVGVRDYRPEDPLRLIHWKATARRGELQTRVTEPTMLLRLTVCLNLDTFDHYWEGLDVELSERMVVLAASLAAWADGARYAVGLCANGLPPGTDRPLRVPAGRGPDHLGRVLAGLARVSPYATVPFAPVLRAEAALAPAGATLAVVTARMPDALATTLAELLAAGHAVTLLPLAGCPVPRLHGLVVRPVEDVTPPADPRTQGSATDPGRSGPTGMQYSEHADGPARTNPLRPRR